MFVIFGEASLPVDPAEEAFDNPSFWYNNKLFAIRAFDDYQAFPPAFAVEPCLQFAAIGTIGQNSL